MNYYAGVDSAAPHGSRPALAPGRSTRARTAWRFGMPAWLRVPFVAIALAVCPFAAWSSGSIMLNVETVDTSSPQAQATRLGVGMFSGKRLHLVQFSGPIKPQYLTDLSNHGLIVVNYIPDNAYLVWGNAQALGRLQVNARAAQSGVQWDGPWKDEYKVHPDVFGDPKSRRQPLAARAAKSDLYIIQLVADFTENAATMRELAGLGGSILSDPGALAGFTNRVVKLPPAALALFAKRPDIISIHPYIEPTPSDERQAIIMAGNLVGNGPALTNYFTLLNNWGFSQSQFDSSGLVVDVTDDGADINPAGGIPINSVVGPVNSNHFVFFTSGNRPIGAPTPSGTSRYTYKGLFGTAGTDGGLGNSGHGQLNMSIVGGYVPSGTVGGVNFDAVPHADASAYRFGLGVAPFVRMGNSVIFDPNYTSPNFTTLMSAVYGTNARISTNSWGSNTGGGYNADSQTYDGLVRDAQPGTAGNQQMMILFSAGNAGPGSTTVNAPGSGKNVLTVGAAEGVQPFGGADGCNVTDAQADSANDMVAFSSRGPTADGRMKPDLVAPGTHISGIAFVTATSTGNASPAATFRGDGVCGGVSPSVPFPAGQNWYTASSGTSHSTPAVAGGAALVYQQFLNNPSYLAANRIPASGAPSPALVKAYLMNSTRYMNGVAANDALWSPGQGMGMVNLGTAFDGVSRAIRDQAPGDRFTASGQVRQFAGTTADPTKPLRITLAWTDVPGSTAGNAYVNNLDLSVVAGGQLYRGNVFSGALSTTGGAADPRNNVESVFLPPGTADFTVIIQGANIAGQADPTVVGPNQDFALVAYSSSPLTASTTAILAPGALTVTSGNGIVEPLECNNFNASLSNLGAGSATVVSSVITSSTPGALITQAASSYPDIASGGSGTNSTPFQLSTSNAIACGSTINLTNTVTFTNGLSPVALPFTVLVGQLQAPSYTFASSSGSIPVGGTLITGSAADDVLVTYAVPFGFSIYGQAVTAGTNIRLSTNGNIQFTPSGGSAAITNTALPAAIFGTVPTVLPYWDDLNLAGGSNGIFADVTGVAPNRTLKLEWRGVLFGTATAINFAVFFHEGSEAFEFVYNNAPAANGASSTVGAQASSTGTQFTQFSFNSATITSGLKLSATRAPAICSPGPAQCSIAPPVITSANNTNFPTGTAGSFTFTATGVPTPGITVAGALPSGVTYNATTRTLSGTPAAGTAGVYPLAVSASNGVLPNAGQSFALTIAAPPPPSNGVAPGTTYITSSSNATPTIIATQNAVCPANGQLIVTATGESGAKSTFAGNAFIGLAFSIARDSTATDNGNVVQSSALATFAGDANRDFLNVQRVDTCNPGQSYTYALTGYATTPETGTSIGSFVFNARMVASNGPAVSSVAAGTTIIDSASNPAPKIITQLAAACPAGGRLFIVGSGESASVSNAAGTSFIGLAYSIARDSTATDNTSVVQSSALSRFNGDANRDFLSVARQDVCTPGQNYTYYLTAYATTSQTSTASSFVWNGRLTAYSVPTVTNFLTGAQYVTNSTNPAPTPLNSLNVVCPASGQSIVTASGESAAVSNFAGSAFIGLAYSIARDGTATDNANVVQSSALASFNGDANRDFLSLQRADSCTPGATNTYNLTVYPTSPQTGASTQSFVWNGRLTALLP